MDKAQFIALLSAAEYTRDDYHAVDELTRRYPAFGLARVLRLKIAEALDMETTMATGLSAVYSSDRAFLYRWLKGEGRVLEHSKGYSTDIEFLESDEDLLEIDGQENDDDEIFSGKETMESDEELGITTPGELADAEMEDPDVDDPVLPVIDHLSVKEENEEVEEAGEEDGAPGEDAQTETGAPSGKIDPVIPLEKGTAADENIDAGERKEAPLNKSKALIERFINSEAGPIPANQPTSLSGDIAENSVKENDSFITDTLAQIYIKQGLYAKAIYAYERLSLKYPEKSAYFAAQIEKIKNLSNS